MATSLAIRWCEEHGYHCDLKGKKFSESLVSLFAENFQHKRHILLEFEKICSDKKEWIDSLLGCMRSKEGQLRCVYFFFVLHTLSDIAEEDKDMLLKLASLIKHVGMASAYINGDLCYGLREDLDTSVADMLVTCVRDALIRHGLAGYSIDRVCEILPTLLFEYLEHRVTHES